MPLHLDWPDACPGLGLLQAGGEEVAGKRFEGSPRQAATWNDCSLYQAAPAGEGAATGFDELPGELAGCVFQLLDPQDIKMARLVSRRAAGPGLLSLDLETWRRTACHQWPIITPVS